MMWLPSFSDVLKTLAHQVGKRYGSLRAATKRRLGWVSPVRILPYRGFGSRTCWHLMGRIMEDKPVGSPREDDSRWDNAKAMYRRFASNAIAGVRVRATVQEQSFESTTDEEGYFRFRFQLPAACETDQLWHTVPLELLDRVATKQEQVTGQGSILVPSAASTFGVISDVDDTVLESHATDFLKMAWITFINNARTRLPLPGVSTFYQALHAGPDGRSQNPFFYVSSSAWNLYDLLEDFLDLHDIPAGPILLRDLAIDDTKLIKSGHEHKLQKIERILSTCDALPFVLIGDAGQEDTVIYREVVRQNPGRVLAIYIRSVSSRRRNEQARLAAEATTQMGVPMLLVEDISQAFQHAAGHGLIRRPSTSTADEQQGA